MNEIDAHTRAETVGSLLRSAENWQAVTQGGPDAEDALDRAVLDGIRIQEEAGLDIITDGELRRFGWADTPRYVKAFEKFEHDRGLEWHGGDGHEPKSTTADFVVRRVATAERVGNRTADYAFLVKHAQTRTKFTLAAPSYHRRYWNDQYSRDAYDGVESYLFEVRDYLRDVVEDLVTLGCDYVQLDAPNYGSLCDIETRARFEAEGRDLDAELNFDAALDNSLFDGIGTVTRALHICRGNSAGGRWHSSGGYGAISKDLFGQLDFDRLLLEYDTERAGTFGPLRDVKPGVVAVLGLLTTKVGDLENVQLVRDRLAEAATLKPLDELAISTQCGFASASTGNPVTPQQQSDKLKLVATLAHSIW